MRTKVDLKTAIYATIFSISEHSNSDVSEC